MSYENIELKGLDEVFNSIDGLVDENKVIAALKEACLIVEGAAKQKAQQFGGDGELARSITSEVKKLTGIVYTPLEYAPYVEYGTGAFREVNPVSGYWVYVKNSDGSVKAKSSKRYTLEKAKQIVAMMRADGLDAVYTEGREATPYMRPALYENREKIIKKIKEGLVND